MDLVELKDKLLEELSDQYVCQEIYDDRYRITLVVAGSEVVRLEVSRAGGVMHVEVVPRLISTQTRTYKPRRDGTINIRRIVAVCRELEAKHARRVAAAREQIENSLASDEIANHGDGIAACTHRLVTNSYSSSLSPPSVRVTIRVAVQDAEKWGLVREALQLLEQAEEPCQRSRE